MQKYGKTLKHGRFFPIFFNFALKFNESMRYYEVEFAVFTQKETLQDVRDVVAALAGEAGFESFEDTDDGLKGYVQQALFDEASLKEMLDALPFSDATVSYTVAEAENRDWNEQWEQEGFEPVYVGEHLIIHDGRHVPHPTPAQLLVEVNTRMAFGTGNHETTRLMAEALMQRDLKRLHVLDCGTGTGVLAIIALLRGAGQAVGYDIDEWSVDNAHHNAVINGVDDRFMSVLGDSTVIGKLGRKFDVVVANINRNILLADMPRMRDAMKPEASLLLSGFYVEDIPLLSAKAEELGMSMEWQKNEGEWACLELKLKD